MINNGGGHLNHALFWELLSPEKTEISEELAQKSMRHSAFLMPLRKHLLQLGQHALVLGWAFLVVNKEGKLEFFHANQDTPIMQGLKPILALDVWEHAIPPKLPQCSTKLHQSLL